MSSLRDQAIALRRKGFSYSLIKQRLGIPKSTLSNWLGNIPFQPNQEVIRRVGLARLKSALYKQRLKFDSIERAKIEAQKDITHLSKRDIFFLGIGLYLGEGEKTFENVKITNADPKIIRLAMKWFYETCGVRKENFRPSVHTYPDNVIKEVLKYWSKEINIPISQFGKTVIDTRQNKSNFKRKKLPHGTLQLRIASNGDPRLGVFLHRKIKAWMESCIAKI